MDRNLEITREKIKGFKASKTKNKDLIARHKWFANIIFKYKSSGMALDIGGREGYLADILLTKGFVVQVIDISPEAITYALERGHEASVCDARHIDLKFKIIFDLIILSHSLEHCTNPQYVAKQCKRILKPDGIIAVQIPLQKKITTPTIYGHNFCFSSPDELFNMFTGFNVLHTEHGSNHNFIAIFKRK
jgi:2-polyprenyl-3-methyl-5-hydroxy-6-metoxy-1,4-benzoquinol methylase